MDKLLKQTPCFLNLLNEFENFWHCTGNHRNQFLHVGEHDYSQRCIILNTFNN